MKAFHAGEGYENFNDFISEEASEYKKSGDGVTYVVWNVMYDKNNTEIARDLVSYYTLSATAIPYEDRIRLDEEEAKAIGDYGTYFRLFPDGVWKICTVTLCEMVIQIMEEKHAGNF